MYGRVLIANRGEIARRVIRACTELGIESVAVHSEPDVDAPFVREADHAVCIGPAKAAESYLNIAAILEAAERTHSQAIHPGYGFLSENALFAQMVLQARLGWIGPPPSVIRTMGEKSSAKAAAQEAGLPVVPGSHGLLASLDEALSLADDMSYPVLLKADAGGGGRGMRKAGNPAELRQGWDEARREAASAFGNDAMYLEKFLGNARHIEFQVLADRWGNAVHLFERECSIQRRHQKLLEEAPSPAVDDALRAQMGEAAVRGAEAIGYDSAGTVEFLLAPDGEFYFMEMNTRIQVEHPVTECVTGIDLVKEQIRVAAGDPLRFEQTDVTVQGHAIECRINAESPRHNFRPAPGRIDLIYFPGGPGIRVDSHIYPGYVVSPHYDSMIAKLVAHGSTRDEAIGRMRRALEELIIEGIPTTAPFHQAVLASDAFAKGEVDTSFVEHFEW